MIARTDRPPNGARYSGHRGTHCNGMRPKDPPPKDPARPADKRPPRGPVQPTPPHPRDPDSLPTPKDGTS